MSDITESPLGVYGFGDPLRHTATMAEDDLHVNFSDTVGDNGSVYDVANGTRELIRPPLFKQSIHMVVLLSVAYITVFLLAVVNNFLVLTVIYKNPQLRTVTNYFLANLAVADITVSFIVLPITLLNNLFSGQYIF